MAMAKNGNGIGNGTKGMDNGLWAFGVESETDLPYFFHVVVLRTIDLFLYWQWSAGFQGISCNHLFMYWGYDDGRTWSFGRGLAALFKTHSFQSNQLATSLFLQFS
jgi:hypothetical protein